MPKLIPLTRQHARGAVALAAALLCTLALPCAARAQTTAPATVSGRVTDGERPAAGVAVVLISNEQGQPRLRVAARTKTDADGHFLLPNVAPGRYQLLPVAPAYIVEGLGSFYPPGRPLTLNPGEELKDIDFKMEPGGVITGRVTDADGNAVVGEQVNAAPVDEQQQGMPRLSFDQRDQATDDRGVYRIYGLPPGRYRVSVGRAGEAGALSLGRRKLFRRTFYPDATDAADARVVELKSGIEATDIDITVGRPLKTYKVSGRFVTADTGEPVAGVGVGYGTRDATGRAAAGFGSGTLTNARGEFVTEGLAPGRYLVYPTNAFGQDESGFYGEGLPFEVTDSDVSGLVVKLKRGATVSGVVTVEGVSDRAAAAQLLSAVRVYSYVEAGRQAGTPGTPRPVPVNPDGTFRVTGLRPGKLRIGTLSEGMKGLATARVELNGANVMNGFDLADGAQVTGVRIVMTYGTGTITGQATYVNGTPPANARVMATARPVGQPSGAAAQRYGEVDGRGFFRIEGLTPGEYEVTVNVFFMGAGSVRPRSSTPQRVSVGEGGEAKVAPVVNFQ